MTHAFENFLLLLSFSRRKVHPKKQSINAYVVFEAEEGAEKALERYSNWQAFNLNCIMAVLRYHNLVNPELKSS